MIGLTPRQRDCLAFYRANPDASLREAARALNVASKQNVYRLLNALEERGYVRRFRNRARAVEIVSPVTIRGETYRFIPMETS